MIAAGPAPLSWYAVSTRSRAEKAVRDQLGTKGFEVLLPTITRWSRWKDRRKKIDWPLFPGYCFVRFDPREALRVLTCGGVETIVSFDGRPAPVSDVEVEGIRRLVTSGLQYDPCPLLKEGSQVEVVRGPLQGIVGLLVKKGPNARLVLSVNLISSAVAVTVDAADVRAF